jgi:endonuclease/exonuclease/phosphatase family metal-dependent hydrolase
VVTFNADQMREFSRLHRLLGDVRADVLAIQEWSGENPPDSLPGWTVRCVGSVCVASRHNIAVPEALDRSMIGGYDAMAVRAVVTTSHGPLSFTSVHLETVREGLEAVLDGRSDALAELRSNIIFRNLESRVIADWIRKTDLPIVVGGDFNLFPTASRTPASASATRSSRRGGARASTTCCTTARGAHCERKSARTSDRITDR